jgi:hypothetical protein
LVIPFEIIVFDELRDRTPDVTLPDRNDPLCDGGAGGPRHSAALEGQHCAHSRRD